MRVIGRVSSFALAFVLIGVLVGFSLAATVDEYGTTGTIPGVNFTGGDGSYKKAVREGITLGVVPDPPWTYQDATTHEYGGPDVWIMQDAKRRLGITKISYQIMPFDGLIPALQAKRIDVIVDNIHENLRPSGDQFYEPVVLVWRCVLGAKGRPQEDRLVGVAQREGRGGAPRDVLPADLGVAERGPEGDQTLFHERRRVR